MLCIAYLDRCTINDSNKIDLLKFPLQGQIQDLWGGKGFEYTNVGSFANFIRAV